ncbi:hypothetical protein PR003_g28138 [Phytophthora rubi]|uniref:BZIP domain-containing protein n=2 Tax=Phytophthora rubi TaxID=129364 RepID=A0A6A4BSJ5_9STRA|nr:hypothetical protein PR001_g30100 [Phytophthora rubi]KAE9279774.1 hypothetical protein PR003_g28138 [Phytophthora rubi]
MYFFSLTNLRSLRDGPPVNGSATRPSCAALVGPRRPPGLRRRRLHSKSCANAKKDEANDRKRRRRHELASVQNSMEQIRRLDEQLALINGRDVVVRQNAQMAAFNVIRVYFERIARGFDPVRYPEQAEATLQFFNAAFVRDLKTNDFTGGKTFFSRVKIIIFACV